MNKTHEISTLFMLLLQYHQRSVDGNILTGDNEDQIVSRSGVSMCTTLCHQWI